MNEKKTVEGAIGLLVKPVEGSGFKTFKVFGDVTYIDDFIYYCDGSSFPREIVEVMYKESNELRYQVTGIRVDNGKMIQGYYCPTSFGRFPVRPAIVIIGEGSSEPFEVDPNTIQPVKIPVVIEGVYGDFDKTPAYYKFHCPGCSRVMDMSEEWFDYCPECGCRFDYTKLHTMRHQEDE